MYVKKSKTDIVKILSSGRHLNGDNGHSQRQDLL